MGVIDNLRNFFTKNSQRTAEAYNRAIYNYLGNSIVWNPESDDTYINEGYRKNATIYSLVNIITKAAASIPFQIYEKVNDNNYKRYKSLTTGLLDNAALTQARLIRKNAMVELEDTELHQLLERPNPAQSYNSFISELLAFGLLTGNRYIYGIGPDTGENSGKYKELYILPSQKMEIISGGLMQPVKEYALQYNGTYKIPAEVICHIKDFNPYYDGSGSNLYGQSPLRAGLRSMTTNNEAVETGVKYLQNQTARGILTTQEEDGISEMQAQQLKDKFRKAHQGSSNAGDILISPKKMSWVNFGLSASDLSLIEQYNASIKDLANIFNVPVQLLNNTDSSSYNNMKEAKKALYQNAVIPHLVKVRDELNRWLVPKYGERLCIDFDFSAISELQEESEKVVSQMAQSWWLTPNEKREAMNYGKVEELSAMDDIYAPVNIMPLGGSDLVLDDKPMNEEQQDDTPKETEEEKSKVPNLPDAYTTQEEAEARAEQLGGSGFHTHEYDGDTIYMPFKTHEEYEEAIKEHTYDHDDDDKYEHVEKQITARLKKALQKKVDDHNEKVTAPTKKATVKMLYAVYKRGVGAFRTNPPDNRPSMNEDSWAFARVNSFLYALKNGKFRKGKHDTDLFPKGHPLSSKKNNDIDLINKAETYDNYPQSATNNAKRMIAWKEKYKDEVKGGTQVGWTRARQLADREALSLDTLKRVKSFLARHQKNAVINPKFKDTPWKDNGYVAYNIWGGESMRKWVNKFLDKLDD